jgi:hypothetical protein
MPNQPIRQGGPGHDQQVAGVHQRPLDRAQGPAGGPRPEHQAVDVQALVGHAGPRRVQPPGEGGDDIDLEVARHYHVGVGQVGAPQRRAA